MLLDALEPVGVSQIALDTGGIAAALGAVATVRPLAAAEVVEYDAFLNLGTVVAPLGTARLGEVALRVKVCYPDGQETQEEVSYGSIKVIPLGPSERHWNYALPVDSTSAWGNRAVVLPLRPKGGFWVSSLMRVADRWISPPMTRIATG
jgi:hypothetical protein